MTRVSVSGVGYVLVPEGWTRWTYGGQVYRRRYRKYMGSVIETYADGRWVQVPATPYFEENKSGEGERIAL